jgi:hypothetical protein
MTQWPLGDAQTFVLRFLAFLFLWEHYNRGPVERHTSDNAVEGSAAVPCTIDSAPARWRPEPALVRRYPKRVLTKPCAHIEQKEAFPSYPKP